MEQVGGVIRHYTSSTQRLARGGKVLLKLERWWHSPLSATPDVLREPPKSAQEEEKPHQPLDLLIRVKDTLSTGKKDERICGLFWSSSLQVLQIAQGTAILALFPRVTSSCNTSLVQVLPWL